MRNLNEQTVTQAAIDLLSGTPDPRLKFILTSLITHLHDFAREVELTEAGVAGRDPIPDRDGAKM